MFSISRRAVLASLALAVGAELLPRVASATLVRGMPLQELVSRSRHVVLGSPLDARCRYLSIGGRSMLITETRLRVESVLALEAPGQAELVIRTLGGVLGGQGEIVHGQAEFQKNKLCVAFLERDANGACWVTGMAEGHYPLDQSEASLILRASPQLPTIRDWEQSAVKRLVGTRLSEAESLIAAVKSR
jgi:hypothetical protein